MKNRKLKFTVVNLVYIGLIFVIGSVMTIINNYNSDYIDFCIFHSGLVTIICGLFTGVNFGTDLLKTWRYRPELDKDVDNIGK